jgi:uncharacterized membrane protein YfcA
VEDRRFPDDDRTLSQPSTLTHHPGVANLAARIFFALDQIMINLLSGFTIGFVLGLLGGGGSILTVPALVYLSGQTPQAAVTASLAIVGANSLAGAYFHSRRSTLNWRVATLFGGAGMLAAFLASGVSRLLPVPVLMAVFAVLMILVGGLMVWQKPPAIAGQTRPAGVILAAGAGIGVLTGFLGVGGGFLVVPALVMLVGLPIEQAIGVSLAVIAANSAAGLLGHLGGAGVNTSLIAVFLITGLAGTFAGARLSQRLPAAILRRMFGMFVIFLGLLLLADNFARIIAL